jgi:hypothetical protein
MKDSRPSLILFIVSASVSLLAKIFGMDMLMVVFKPMVIPAIFYYYLQTKKGRVNPAFVTVLWCFFAGDMLMVLAPDATISVVMGFTMVSYLLLLKFLLEEKARARFSFFNIILLSLLLLLLGYFLFTILNLGSDKINRHYFLYLAYGIILIALTATAVFRYLGNGSAAALNACAMALCMLASDLLYCIYKFVVHVSIIDDINLLAQFMSYFFMVRYFNSKRRKTLRHP